MIPEKTSIIQDYIALGWHLVPVHYITAQGKCSCGSPKCERSAGKHPAAVNGVYSSVADAAQIQRAIRRGFNVGLDLGRSGLVALDVDPRNGGDETLAALLRMHGPLPETAIAVSGGGGNHYLFTVPDGMRLRMLGPGLDSLGPGKIIAIEPSIHQSGSPYHWEAAFDPTDGQAIAQAPDWMIEPITSTQAIHPIDEPARILTREQVRDIRAALGYLDADDYHTWIAIGHDLKSSRAGRQAFGLWVEWSRLSEKFEPGEAGRKWASFDPAKGVLEAVFRRAMAAGWINDGSSIEIGRPEPQPEPPPQKKPDPQPEVIPEIPGILGDVAKWVGQNSRKPQPLLDVQTALAFGAVVLGRRYVTSNRNFSNLFFLNIAPSGAGKEHAKSSLERLLSECKLEKLIGSNRYASESGVLSALIAQPVQLGVLDEFGKTLTEAQVAGNFAARDVVKSFMEIWGRADGTLRPVAYSTVGLSEIQKTELAGRYVTRPSLSVVAMCTPSTLYEGISSRSLADGLLNRFLIAFATTGRQAGRMITPSPVPGSIKTWAKKMRPWNADAQANQEPPEVVVPISPAAATIFRNFEQFCIDQMDALDEIGMAEMYGRTAEMAMRVALIISQSDEAREIQSSHAQWAVDFVSKRQEIAVREFSRHIADNPFHGLVNAILGAIRDAGARGMTHRELTQYCRPYKSARPAFQDEAILSLVRSEDIRQAVFDSASGRGKKRVSWVAEGE